MVHYEHVNFEFLSDSVKIIKCTDHHQHVRHMLKHVISVRL